MADNLYAALEWVFIFDLLLVTGLLGFDLIRDLVIGRMSRLRFFDTIASLSTQLPFNLMDLAAYNLLLLAYYGAQALAPFRIETGVASLAILLLLADFAYYWEHRCSHRIRLLWTSHAVHHSAPIMNTAVALRFGFLDPFISIPFFVPLVLIGFDPLAVMLAHLIVVAYQTWLHNDFIGTLGFLEGILNTPSNHRVHHGSNEQYLDRNYGGILILWDRLFGTYAAEKEPVIYGLTEPINTVNPIRVWFSELPKLARDLVSARTVGEFCGYLVKGPGWRPPQSPTT